MLWEHLEPGNELLAQKMQNKELLKQLSKEHICSGERRVWERRRGGGGRDTAVPRAGNGWQCRGKGRVVTHEQEDTS